MVHYAIEKIASYFYLRKKFGNSASGIYLNFICGVSEARQGDKNWNPIAVAAFPEQSLNLWKHLYLFQPCGVANTKICVQLNLLELHQGR